MPAAEIGEQGGVAWMTREKLPYEPCGESVVIGFIGKCLEGSGCGGIAHAEESEHSLHFGKAQREAGTLVGKKIGGDCRTRRDLPKIGVARDIGQRSLDVAIFRRR